MELFLNPTASATKNLRRTIKKGETSSDTVPLMLLDLQKIDLNYVGGAIRMTSLNPEFVIEKNLFQGVYEIYQEGKYGELVELLNNAKSVVEEKMAKKYKANLFSAAIKTGYMERCDRGFLIVEACERIINFIQNDLMPKHDF